VQSERFWIQPPDNDSFSWAWSLQGGGAEDSGLVGCDAVSLCCCVRCSQRLEWKYCHQLKRWGTSKYWTAWTLKKTALQFLETSKTSHLTTQCYSYADTNPHPKRFPQKRADSDVEAPNQSAPPAMRGSSASRWSVSVSSHLVLHRATFTTQLYASHARRVQLSTRRRLILRLDFWLAVLLRRLW
jgi:hypothetical protein